MAACENFPLTHLAAAGLILLMLLAIKFNKSKAIVFGIYTHLHTFISRRFYADWFTQILHRKIGVKRFLRLCVKWYSNLN